MRCKKKIWPYTGVWYRTHTNGNRVSVGPRASVIKTICRGVVGRAKLLLYYRTCLNNGDPFITRLVIARIFFSPSINIALTATKSCRRRPIRQHKRVTTTHRRSIIILLLLSSSYFTLWCCIYYYYYCASDEIFICFPTLYLDT